MSKITNKKYFRIKDIMEMYTVSRAKVGRWRKKDSNGESFFHHIPFPEPINKSAHSPLFNADEVERWTKIEDNIKRKHRQITLYI